MSDEPLDAAVLDRLRQLTGPGEPDVLDEVLDIFRRDVPVRLLRLVQAAGGTDLDTVERMAHSIKGSAANIGACTLEQTSAMLEQAARRADPTAVAEAIPAVQAEMARVMEAIRRLTGKQ
jgi:HPt (histidine-containing phosphotransfer) domain-containing protein